LITKRQTTANQFIKKTVRWFAALKGNGAFCQNSAIKKV